MTTTQEEFDVLVERIVSISDSDAKSFPQMKLSMLAAWADRNLGESKHDQCREVIAAAQADADTAKEQLKKEKEKAKSKAKE